jgi:hypothetical protein
MVKIATERSERGLINRLVDDDDPNGVAISVLKEVDALTDEEVEEFFRDWPSLRGECCVRKPIRLEAAQSQLPESLPDLASLYETIENWLGCARMQVRMIARWRDCPSQLKRWPECPDYFWDCWSAEIRRLIAGDFPFLDDTPIREIHDAVNAWNYDRNATAVLPQPALKEALRLAVATIEELKSLIKLRWQQHSQRWPWQSVREIPLDEPATANATPSKTSDRGRRSTSKTKAGKKRGRPVTSKSLANFVNARRGEGKRNKMPWDEVIVEWNTAHPDEPTTFARARAAYRRHYKAQRPN